jgi:hypothetical protein
VSTALSTVTLSGVQSTTAFATCPTGKRVFGGGYETTGTSVLQPVSMYPTTVSTWSVTLRHNQPDATATFGFRVYAVCSTATN